MWTTSIKNEKVNQIRGKTECGMQLSKMSKCSLHSFVCKFIKFEQTMLDGTKQQFLFQQVRKPSGEQRFHHQRYIHTERNANPSASSSDSSRPQHLGRPRGFHSRKVIPSPLDVPIRKMMSFTFFMQLDLHRRIKGRWTVWHFNHLVQDREIALECDLHRWRSRQLYQEFSGIIN